VSKLRFPLLLAVGLAFWGCGNPQEQAALERIQKRKDPGFIRLVNLTDDSSQLKVNGKNYGQAVLPMKSNVFLACPTGETKIVVEGLGQALSHDVKSKDVVSVYLLEEQGKKVAKLVLGEPRNLPKGSTHVSFLATDSGVSYKAKTDQGDIEVPVLRPSTAIAVSPGDFKSKITSSAGQTVEVDFDTIDQGAYTVVVQQAGGKPRTTILSNHPDRGLSMAGATGA
jgi:hypothetical protein